MQHPNAAAAIPWFTRGAGCIAQIDSEIIFKTHFSWEDDNHDIPRALCIAFRQDGMWRLEEPLIGFAC